MRSQNVGKTDIRFSYFTFQVQKFQNINWTIP